MKRGQGSRAISLGVGVASSGVVPLGRALSNCGNTGCVDTEPRIPPPPLRRPFVSLHSSRLFLELLGPRLSSLTVACDHLQTPGQGP